MYIGIYGYKCAVNSLIARSAIDVVVNVGEFGLLYLSFLYF